MTQQSYHHGNLREALINGAIKCIREHGKEKLSLRGLAREVGVSQSAPYRHFSDKNALLTAIISEGFTSMTELFAKSTEELMDRPEEALQASGRAYVDFAINNPETYRLMFSRPKSEFCDDEMEAEATGCFEVLQTIIANGQRQGIFKQAPIEMMSLAAWSMVHGYVSLLIDGVLDEPELVQNVDEFSIGQVLIQGMKA